MKILAQGDSMLPTLQSGIYYEIEPVVSGDIEVNDIIVFCVDEIVICHRVIKIIESKNGTRFFVTKGDNCHNKDAYAVTKEMIIGRICK